MHVATRIEARTRAAHALEVEIATDARDVEAAQRLRCRVFGDEMGARIASRASGRDQDFFDPWCEHLVVRDVVADDIVGTYRILTPERAQQLGTYYADTEFELSRLAPIRPRTVEIGRACVAPAYRTGATLMLLWQGLAAFMQARGHAYLIGCASISMRDGGANALAIWRDVAPRHLAPAEYRVFPRHPLAASPERDAPGPAAQEAAVPPLLRGYLRMGAWIGGEPAWDRDFNTADLFLLMPLARLARPYARHYLTAA